MNKTNIALMSGIMAVVASIFFLALPTTPLLIAAYVFALLGIVVLCFGTIHLLNRGRHSPWFAALPMVAWAYLITQVFFSAIPIAVERVFGWAIPIAWFCLLHIVMLAVAVAVLVTLNTRWGAIESPIADAGGEEVGLRFQAAELAAASEKLPSVKMEIKTAADALRRSDPLGVPALATYDKAIGDSVALIVQAAENGDAQSVPALCNTLVRQIKDRNFRLKAMK